MASPIVKDAWLPTMISSSSGKVFSMAVWRGVIQSHSIMKGYPIVSQIKDYSGHHINRRREFRDSPRYSLRCKKWRESKQTQKDDRRNDQLIIQSFNQRING